MDKYAPHKHSPDKRPFIRGRTIKEHEEQLKKLQKENFDLKLRIYLSEKQMGLMSGDSGWKDSIKTTVDLIEEVEDLRKQKEEKEELIRKAQQLLDIADQECESRIREKDSEITVLKSQIVDIEKELEVFRCSKDKNSDNKNVDRKILDLEESIHKLNETIKYQELQMKEKDQEISKFEATLEESVQEIKRLNTVIFERDKLLNSLKQKTKTFESEVQSLRNKVQSSSKSPTRHSCKEALQKVMDKYKRLKGEHQKAICYIEDLINKGSIQTRELETIQADVMEKEKHIHNLKIKMGKMQAATNTETRGDYCGDEHAEVPPQPINHCVFHN